MASRWWEHVEPLPHLLRVVRGPHRVSDQPRRGTPGAAGARHADHRHAIESASEVEVVESHLARSPRDLDLGPGRWSSGR